MALFQKSVLNKHLSTLGEEKVAITYEQFQSNYNPNKIEQIKNISPFYYFDFKIFVSELKKQKVTLSLNQQDEREDYFNTYKTEINNLQAQINQTDQQIDQMVYDLYGLTDEEIGIVEGRK